MVNVRRGGGDPEDTRHELKRKLAEIKNGTRWTYMRREKEASKKTGGTKGKEGQGEPTTVNELAIVVVPQIFNTLASDMCMGSQAMEDEDKDEQRETVEGRREESEVEEAMVHMQENDMERENMKGRRIQTHWGKWKLTLKLKSGKERR